MLHFFKCLQKSVNNSSSGDLMADLHKKLAMRRKGISGAKDNQAPAGNTTPSVMPSANLLDSISSMIPPPPKQDTSANTDRSDDDSEWE